MIYSIDRQRFVKIRAALRRLDRYLAEFDGSGSTDTWRLLLAAELASEFAANSLVQLDPTLPLLDAGFAALDGLGDGLPL